MLWPRGAASHEPPGQPVLSWFASALGAPYCHPASGEPQLQTHDGFCSETYEFSH